MARIDVVVVEKRATQEVAGSRAGGLHARALEVLDQRGVADRFIAQGKRGGQIPAFAGMLDIGDLPTRHNYTLALRQERIERILADWVAELAVPILRGIEVVDFAQDDAGVEVFLSDDRSLRAQFLIGCDGGRSLIRKNAGIDFPGWDASTSYLIAEAETTEEPAWGARYGERGTNALAKLDDGKRVRAVLVEPDALHADDPTLEDLRRALIAVYGTDFGVHHVTFLSRFTDAARQAAASRSVRMFALMHDARPILLHFGARGAFDISPWANRIKVIDANYAGKWVLPVIGEVAAPIAVLIRPDGYVAWVGIGNDHGLREALTLWFGNAS